jgi:hypothetical protein
MRKRFRVLLLAAIVAAVVVPVGFALSLDKTGPVSAVRSNPPSLVASTVVATPVLVETGAVRAGSVDALSDPMKLLVVGSIFLGTAAIVRRTI